MIEIIKADPDMLNAIHEIEKASFTSPWSIESFKAILSSGSVRTAVITDDANIVGFYCVSTIMDESELLNIAVSPAYRHKGYGKMLMKDLLIHSSKSGAKCMYLEVRRSNTPAFGMYESFGFKQIGIRRNYYTEPREDAIVMCCDLP